MIYNKITELCKSKNISISKMCAEIGLSNATATKWKKGATPDVTTILKISKYFNVPLEYFYDYSTPVGRELIEDFQNRSNMAAYEVTKGFNKITLIKNSNFITVDLTHEQLEKISRLLEIAMPELFEKFKYFELFDNEE